MDCPILLLTVPDYGLAGFALLKGYVRGGRTPTTVSHEGQPI